MNPKKLPRLLLCAALAAALALPAGRAALGASLPPGFPTPEPGKTTVGVQTADLPPDNLSFTVPLYLTVAAIPEAGSGGKLVTPDGYALRNTTASLPDGSYPGIAVTGMVVRGVAGGTWSLTTTTPQDARDIALSIGGVRLPAVPAGAGAPIDIVLTASRNSFYDGAGRFIPIEGGRNPPALTLPVEGALSPLFSAAPKPAAPQFRVTYTVSLLDGAGKPVGTYYDGPAREEAAAPSPAPAPP